MTLPPGFTVRIGAEVWRHDGGRTLVGGAPARVIRLSPRARRLVRRGRIVAADPASTALAERLLDAGLAHPVIETLPPVPLDALTVVVPAYGRGGAVRRLLESLPGVRTIVVDDGTPEPDATALAAAVEAAGARLHRLETNAGPAAARNAGLALVDTPLVAFLDADVVVPPGTLETLARHFHDPGLALVGPRILGLEPEEPNWISRYESSRSSLDLGTRPALVRPKSRVSWLSSTCLVARVEAIGHGFDASMRVGEDVDLVWRLAEEGRRVRFEPAVHVRHEHRATLASWLGRKAFYGSGAAPLADRHPTAIAPAVLRPWSAILLAGVAIGTPWSLGAAGVAVGIAAQRLHDSLPVEARSRILTARLIGSGVGSALAQGSALALRHWWPLAAAAAIRSRRARRLIAAGAVADAAVEYVRLRPALDPVRFALARRLDDLAYGAGLWAGVVRRRRVRALLPELAPPEPRRDASGSE